MHLDSHGCKPAEHPSAWQGWYAGVCLTQEQVWCRAHGNVHVNCETADCRAEEIRLSLYRSREGQAVPSVKPKYPGCSQDNFDKLYAHFNNMNAKFKRITGKLWSPCGACVPDYDPRAAFLPNCTEARAFCRGLHYVPLQNSTAKSWDCIEEPRDYANVATRRNTKFGCFKEIDA